MPRRRIGFWYRFAAVICKPPLVVLLRRDWRGMEHIPAEGGFITAVNHNSHVDPFAYAHFQYNTGRVPRFLAKSGLFKKGFVGAAMRGTGLAGHGPQIRVALQTKCPVIPVAQWGANELLPPYAKKPHLFPRKTHRVLAGPPVDLSAFYDQEMTPELLKEATEVIMAAITRQLEEIRGEKAPDVPYDPRRERIEQRRRTTAQNSRAQGEQAEQEEGQGT